MREGEAGWSSINGCEGNFFTEIRWVPEFKTFTLLPVKKPHPWLVWSSHSSQKFRQFQSLF